MATASNRPSVRGKVERINEEWTNASGSFSKREIVVETGFRYPCPILVTFKKDKIALLDGLAEGDEVSIEYALDGRKWDGPNGTKYFVEVVGLSLEKSGGAAAPTPAPGKPHGIGCTLEHCVEVWTKIHGDDKAGFAAFCQTARPDIVAEAKAAGKKFTAYALNKLSVWADIANRIENEANMAQAEIDSAEGDPDDLPF